MATTSNRVVSSAVGQPGRVLVSAALVLGLACGAAFGQPGPTVKRTPAKPIEQVTVERKDLDEAVKQGVAILLRMQARGELGTAAEGYKPGDGPREWPYEGVYRAGGRIPIGYRVGGTSIAVMALLQAPGYAEDGDRKKAVEAATEFICTSTEHPLMSVDDYDAGYDVRGWGYTYGLLCLCELKAAKAVPERLAAEVERASKFYIDALDRTQIPKVGGWNYARPAGKEKVAAPSTFMTPPSLQALMAAKAQGFKVNEDTLESGLRFLEKSVAADEDKNAGSVPYAGETNPKRSEKIPGAIGRMCITEATLAMAGKSSPARLKRAVEAFIKNWVELDKRRQKTGTHEGDYGVAPYYFMFAHHAASQAIEMLPKEERAAMREQCDKLLFSVRAEDGGWNDRVFLRSEGYGTAMAMMAMMGPKTYAYVPRAGEGAGGKPGEKPADAPAIAPEQKPANMPG